ncbi:MAG: hypothetical protein AB2A00_25040 [Myxococcota bacterium]
MKRLATWMVLIAVLLLPELVLACPACALRQEKNRVAYLVTTALLSVIPLLSVGGLVWWMRKRLAEQEQAQRAGPATPAQELRRLPSET